MPFQPSSPTRLYQSRRYKKSIPSILEAETSSSAATAETIKDRHQSSKTQHTEPPIETNLTTMSAKDDTFGRRSSSLWKGAMTGRRGSKHANDSTQTIRKDTISSPDEACLASSREFYNTDATSESMDVTDLEQRNFQRQSSFFDNASESEYSAEDDSRPVVGRASSVRVNKIQIVQHKPTKNLVVISNEAASCSDTLPSTLEKGAQVKVAVNMDPASCDHFQQASSKDFSSIPATTPHSLGQDPAGMNAPFPAGSTIRSVNPTFGDLDLPYSTDSTEQHGVQSNPIPGINRTLSSPLPLPIKALSRRVTIRPADLIIRNHNEQSSFRESVVTTPYPGRMSAEPNSVSFEKVDEEYTEAANRRRSKARNKERQRASFIGALISKDRFPSPERPEVLFLNLGLLNHPGARTTIEIQIENKSSFDDEMFFCQIRTAYYKQLLGNSRRAFVLVRRVGNITVTAPSDHNSVSFDNIDFMKHFHDPKVGRKRKTWIIWLRNNNPQSMTPTLVLPRADGPLHAIDSLNCLSLRTRSPGHSRQTSGKDAHPTNREAERNKRLSTASDASSFNFIYSPAIPRLPFMSSLTSPPTAANATPGSSPARSFFWPSNFSSLPALRANTIESSNDAVRIITLSFQHELRPATIALLTLLNILQALLAGLIWVVFGVPGTRPGMDGQSYKVGGRPFTSDWREDAGSRVLAGVVVGLAFLLTGVLVEGLLIWGGCWLL